MAITELSPKGFILLLLSSQCHGSIPVVCREIRGRTIDLALDLSTIPEACILIA